MEDCGRLLAFLQPLVIFFLGHLLLRQSIAGRWEVRGELLAPLAFKTQAVIANPVVKLHCIVHFKKRLHSAQLRMGYRQLTELADVPNDAVDQFLALGLGPSSPDGFNALHELWIEVAHSGTILLPLYIGGA